MMNGKPGKFMQSSYLDLGLRVLSMVLAIGAAGLFWMDLLSAKGAIGLMGGAVIALTLERIKDY